MEGVGRRKVSNESRLFVLLLSETQKKKRKKNKWLTSLIWIIGTSGVGKGNPGKITLSSYNPGPGMQREMQWFKDLIILLLTSNTNFITSPDVELDEGSSYEIFFSITPTAQG